MDVTHDGLKENNHVLENAGERIIQVPTRYAGFWMRFWAYLLDLLVIGSINRILIYPAFRALDIPLSKAEIFSAASISTAAVFYLYFILMTKFFRQTLGKMIFGIKVISLDKPNLSWQTVLFREFIGRYISKLFFIGYILVAFLPKKQGIHDLFSDTTVVHEDK
ncbi:RDD family protein [Ferdinandcohnia sp. Marseille-Q9671]